MPLISVREAEVTPAAAGATVRPLSTRSEGSPVGEAERHRQAREHERLT